MTGAAFTWDEHTREFWRDQARAHPHGIASTLAGLSELLDGAERRAARADDLQARLDAVLAIHQPTGDGLDCCTCMGELGAPADWPCPTAEAGAAARGET